MTEDDNDPIAKALDMMPIVSIVKDEPNEVVPAEPVDSLSLDFGTARKNITDVLEKGMVAFNDLLRVAKSSQHPRAYEVAANFLSTLVAGHKDLLDIHKLNNEIVSEVPNSMTQNNTTTNNLFVTTTALQKMLKQMDEISVQEDKTIEHE